MMAMMASRHGNAFRNICEENLSIVPALCKSNPSIDFPNKGSIMRSLL